MLLALLRRGLVDAEDVAEMTALVARVLDVQALSFGPGFGFSPLVSVRDIDEGWRTFHTRHREEDPSPGFLERSGGAPFRVMTDSTPVHRRSEIHRGLVRFGFADAAITMYEGLGGRHWMALYRAKGAPIFDDDDALMIQLLEPHITRSLGTGLAAAAFQGGEDAAISIGWVDLPGRTFHLAPRAASELVVHLGIETERALSRFGVMLVERAARSPGVPPPLLVSSRYQLEGAIVDPRRSGPRPVDAIERRVFFALCSRPTPPKASDLLGLLSPAQREVAARVAAGEALRQVAKGLGITYETARTHMREIYRRLDVHGRAELRERLSQR